MRQASHELFATATGLADQSSNLQRQVDFFQLDTSGSGWTVRGQWGSAAVAHRGGGATALKPGQAAPSAGAQGNSVPRIRRPSRDRPRRTAVWFIPLPRRHCHRILVRRRSRVIHPAIQVPRRAAESWLTLTTTTISSDSHERTIDP